MITNEWPTITVNTTLDELKEIHEHIWNYVIEHGCKPLTPYFNDCACCEYDEQKILETLNNCETPVSCYFCPLGKTFCDTGGLYTRWIKELNIDEAKRLATLIRDAPFALPD